MFSWECMNFLKQQKQPPEVLRKKNVLKNFANLQENSVGDSLVSLESTSLKRDSKTDIFLLILRNFCKYFEIFENTYFKEHLRTTAP